MLVLTRKTGERLHLGQDIVVKVVKVRGNSVQLGIEAPPEVAILRSELLPQQPREDHAENVSGIQNPPPVQMALPVGTHASSLVSG